MTTKNQQVTSASRTVIRGESPENLSSKDIAFIDWLGFTIKNISLGEVREALEHIFNLSNLEWLPSNKGWSGYEHRIDLGCYGWLAHGGVSQKGTINIQLRPSACANFKDTNSIIDWSEKHQAIITRCDLAHDDFEGKIINIEQARKWNDENGYTTNGRKPKPREIINHDKTIGNTFYIGKRQNGKMLRIYEKGKEQGHPTSPWNRLEVEFRNKDRLIPWDIIKNPSIYLSGAYPCLNFLSIIQDRIKTIKKSHEISYNYMVNWLRTSGGKAINAMMIHEHGDVYKVFSDIKREGVPKRLENTMSLIVNQ